MIKPKLGSKYSLQSLYKKIRILALNPFFFLPRLLSFFGNVKSLSSLFSLFASIACILATEIHCAFSFLRSVLVALIFGNMKSLNSFFLHSAWVARILAT